MSMSPVGAVVAEERHQDGNKHFHAYILYEKKIDTKNCRLYDFKNHHPNV